MYYLNEFYDTKAVTEILISLQVGWHYEINAILIKSKKRTNRKCTMFIKYQTTLVWKGNNDRAQCFTITLYYKVTDYWDTSISSDKHQTIITMPKLNIIAL